jgi:hypothetical protein
MWGSGLWSGGTWGGAVDSIVEHDWLGGQDVVLQHDLVFLGRGVKLDLHITKLLGRHAIVDGHPLVCARVREEWWRARSRENCISSQKERARRAHTACVVDAMRLADRELHTIRTITVERRDGDDERGRDEGLNEEEEVSSADRPGACSARAASPVRPHTSRRTSAQPAQLSGWM